MNMITTLEMPISLIFEAGNVSRLNLIKFYPSEETSSISCSFIIIIHQSLERERERVKTTEKKKENK